MHVVNNSPYMLSVRVKPKGRTDLVGDSAGLTVSGIFLFVLKVYPECSSDIRVCCTHTDAGQRQNP